MFVVDTMVLTCKYRNNGRECPHGCTAFATVCHQYVRAGNCRRGHRCRLFHPCQEPRAEQNEQNAAPPPHQAPKEPEAVRIWPYEPTMLRALQDLRMHTLNSFSLRDVKNAYRAAARRHHPDKGGLTSDFRCVQEAYEYLSGLFSGS